MITTPPWVGGTRRYRRGEGGCIEFNTLQAFDDIGFEGKFFKVPNLKLGPPPVQKKLPILVWGFRPQTFGARRQPSRSAEGVSAAQQRGTEGSLCALHRLCKRVGYRPEERPIIRETLVLDTVEEAERFGELGTDGLFGIYGRKSAEGERPLRTDQVSW